LPKEAKKEFRRAAHLLMKQGILTKWDYPTLVLYAKAWAEWREADLAVKGLFVKTVNGNIVQHPALGIRARAWDRVLKAAREFGFSPASRASLASVNPTPAAVDAEKEKFFIKGA
jgi:P27 family predicted phage terminase small subunit